MNAKKIVAAVVALFGMSAVTAAPMTVNVDSITHGVYGNANIGQHIMGEAPNGQWWSAPTNMGALNTGAAVGIGDTVSISSGVDDRWSINNNAVTSHGTLTVFGAWNTERFSAIFPNQTKALQYGSLVYSFDGMTWDHVYTNPLDVNDTSILVVAAKAGSLRLGMWDSIVSDNTSRGADRILAVTYDITPANRAANAVPEPGSLALVGLALGFAGACVRRR